MLQQYQHGIRRVEIFIQIFAVVAEFERDTLTERITDNMMELAKDGRWLGRQYPNRLYGEARENRQWQNKSAYAI